MKNGRYVVDFTAGCTRLRQHAERRTSRKARNHKPQEAKRSFALFTPKGVPCAETRKEIATPVARVRNDNKALHGFTMMARATDETAFP